MSGSRRKLTSKQRTAITRFLEGKNAVQVAESVGVSERSLSRWNADEYFTSELRQAELRVLDSVVLRLVSMSGDAVNALQDVLENPSVRGASVKRLTAKDILEMVLKWREQVELEERILELERKVFNG